MFKKPDSGTQRCPKNALNNCRVEIFQKKRMSEKCRNNNNNNSDNLDPLTLPRRWS